jgi:hypothetical protein
MTSVMGRRQMVVRSIVEHLNPMWDRYSVNAKAEPTLPAQTNCQGPMGNEICRTVFDAWEAVAKKNNLPEPDAEQVQFALSIGPEESIITGFT